MRTHEATEREAAGHPGPTSGPNLQPVLSGALLETAPSPGSRQNRGMQGGGVGCRGGRDRRRCEPLRRSRERARRKPSAGDVGLRPPNRPRPVQMREPASPIRCILLTLKRCSPSALVAPHSRRPRAGAPQGPSGKKYRDPARAACDLRGARVPSDRSVAVSFDRFAEGKSAGVSACTGASTHRPFARSAISIAAASSTGFSPTCP